MGRLFDRIKSVVKKLKLPKLPFFGKEPLPEEDEGLPPEELARPVEKATYLQDAQIVTIIRKSARNKTLVKLLYGNVWRFAEPYSFRQGKHGLLFFAHDLARNDTRSYYIHRIQELQSTEIPFNPRWMVEL
jgi:hypothetical protein